MTVPRVWAPRPGTVELETPAGRVPMHRGDDGWWSAPHPVEGRYRFVVDGDPIPDPRSRWQPEGVDGWSSTFDHAGFAWTDGRWHGAPLGAAVISEIHIGTFTPDGTFDAAIDRLDDLVELGVTAVELMPVAEFPGVRGWGYDGVLLWAPHHAYGGPAGLQRFVDAAHHRGLAVVLDVVYNHLGPSGNHLGRFGPYFTDEYRTPWGDAVNLDGPGSDEVRRFFLDNARSWIRDFHIDGVRLDAVHALLDRSALPFVEQLATELHELGRQLGRTVWVIAEHDGNDPRLVVPADANGLGLDAVWSDDFHHAVHAVLAGETDGYYLDFGGLEPLAAALEQVYVHAGQPSRFRERCHGRPVGAIPRHRFLGYAQTHDQIGNRAHGERLVHLVGVERAEIAAALVLTSPFVPMLFQGEEWGASSPFQYFTDHTDPELGRAVSEGRRREFGAFSTGDCPVPDPQDPETFRASVLRWEEREVGDHRRLLAWHRRLLALRRDVPDLTTAGPADTAVTFDERQQWLIVRRGGCALVVNLADRPNELDTFVADAEVLLSNGVARPIGDGRIHVGPLTATVVGPRSARVGPAGRFTVPTAG